MYRSCADKNEDAFSETLAPGEENINGKTDSGWGARGSTVTIITHTSVVSNLDNKLGLKNETSNTNITFDLQHTIFCDVLDENTSLEIQKNELEEKYLKTNNEAQVDRAKKERKRTHPCHTRVQKKARKYANLPYHVKNKLMPAKEFKDCACSCTKQCFVRVSKDKRKKEFEKYITLGSYEAQLLFILNNVKESPKARSYTTTVNKSGKKKPRQYRRNYSICEIDVCKEMFLNNFQISSKKIDVCLLKKRSSNSFKDQRGKIQGGWNKTSEKDIEFIKNVINALPKYESHDTSKTNNDCQYLKPGMTVQKIYTIYSEELKRVYGTSKVPVSINTVKNIFYSNFNLRCKPIKKGEM